jgi:Hypervirulence associated proteins TUDOR domain
MSMIDRNTEEERKQMSQEFERGDRVTWNSHSGNAEGEVLRKITEDTELAGRKVRASKDDPQYLVRSDKSGGEAVHKPSALKKKG